MSVLLYYNFPYIPFFIDLIVIIPFWRLVSVVGVSDYLAIYMIAVNIPFTIRLVPQYINLLAPTAANAYKKTDSTQQPKPPPPPPPLGSPPNQIFFSMMSAFVVITVCYGAFIVMLSMLQEIRRGKPSGWHLWLPFVMMMTITQIVLMAVYTFNFLSETVILFLVMYYIVVCAVMTVIVMIFLRRQRPQDPTWEKRRQTIKQRFNRFLLFSFITVLPSVFYMHRMSVDLIRWFTISEEMASLYTFTDYMFHPWIFNLVGLLLLDPFRKVTIGHLQPLGAYYRRYRGNFSSPTVPAVYRVPPPSYSDVTQKTKALRPLQMY
ncbi:unnamed protein product [Nippostrongylus brasiliensis]|uniref:Serpentine receptor class gamma n=1 Tax=Nippostrongylus brasiliensis TaxID=27835 RepID=A0A0N4Y9B4_NIPBR|nr:hypothetical protein Q1695_005200 [Nippostrongylus brasiliensis]VDL76473.1 unnamed protein product [Nippostrongylus brasiliensis]